MSSDDAFESVPNTDNDNIDQELMNQSGLKIFSNSQGEPLQVFIPINENDRDNLVKLITNHGGKIIEDPSAGYYISKHHDPLRDAIDPRFVYESVDQKTLLKVDNYKLYHTNVTSESERVQQLVTYLHNDNNGAGVGKSGSDVDSNLVVTGTPPTLESHPPANKNGFTPEEDAMILETIRRNPSRRSTHLLFKEIADQIGRHTGNSVRYRYRTFLAPTLDYVYMTDASGQLVLDEDGQPIIAEKLPSTLKTKFTADEDYKLCTLVRDNLIEKQGEDYKPDPKEVILPGKFFDALAKECPNHTRSAWRDRYRKFVIPYGIDKYIEYYTTEQESGREPEVIKNFTGKHLKSKKRAKKDDDIDEEVGERLTEHNDQYDQQQSGKAKKQAKRKKIDAADVSQDANNLFASGDQSELSALNGSQDFFDSHAAAAVAAAHRLNNPPQPEDFLTSDLVTTRFFEFQPLITVVEKITEIVNRSYQSNDAEQLITALYAEAGIQKKFGTFIITSVCGDLILIPKFVEIFLKTGENPPQNVHGIWTPRDDEYLKSEIPERMDYLRRLHGTRRIDLRRSFITGDYV